MSMSDSEGGDVGIEGAVGGGMALDVDAIAAQASFSSSRLFQVSLQSFSIHVGLRTYSLISASSSCSVALFFSFCGFGFFTTGGSAVSVCTLVNASSSRSQSMHLLCCTSRTNRICQRNRPGALVVSPVLGFSQPCTPISIFVPHTSHDRIRILNVA